MSGVGSPAVRTFTPRLGITTNERMQRMSNHKATISWKRTSEDFLKGKYSREHLDFRVIVNIEHRDV